MSNGYPPLRTTRMKFWNWMRSKSPRSHQNLKLSSKNSKKSRDYLWWPVISKPLRISLSLRSSRNSILQTTKSKEKSSRISLCILISNNYLWAPIPLAMSKILKLWWSLIRHWQHCCWMNHCWQRTTRTIEKRCSKCKDVLM